MNLKCSKCLGSVTPVNLDFTFGKKEWSNGRVFWPGDAEYETKCCGAEVLNMVQCAIEPAIRHLLPLTDDELDALFAEGRRLSEEASCD